MLQAKSKVNAENISQRALNTNETLSFPRGQGKEGTIIDTVYTTV